MKIRNLKAILSFFLLIFFSFNQIFSYIPYLKVSETHAKETTPTKVNIVALLVDNKIYDALRGDIEWYAKYIQKGWNNAISHAKPLILRINTQEIGAPDIVKILENLYFNGIKDQASILKWVILVWDIPFPVVNDNEYIFPTIYPYVDFEQQKFIWDEDKKYFIPNPKTDSQPEVFHSLIKYDEIKDYKNFFAKVMKYDSNPHTYIWKNIWYEDMIANKKYYLDEIQTTYINNWLFAEDVWYHRYTNLLLKIIQKINEWDIDNILKNLPWWGNAKWVLEQTVKNVPTLMLAKTIKESWIKAYNMIWSTKLLSRIRSNLEYANRWIEKYQDIDGTKKTRLNWDSHMKKVTLKDELLTSYNSNTNNLFVDLNNYLEEEVNAKVEKEQYYMHVPLPLEYLEYEREKKKILLVKKVTRRNKYNAYKNYFFWQDAAYIEKMQDTTIERWTFRNLDNLDGVSFQSIQKSPNPATDLDIDLQTKSIGASYDIFSQQVQANRGFNYLNVNEELEVYNTNKTVQPSWWAMKCKWFRLWWWCLGLWRWEKVWECDIGNTEKQKDCETMYDFGMRNRWWASPLNLDSIEKKTWKKEYHPKNARMSIFDIAGSAGVEKPNYMANSFASLVQSTTLTQERFSGEGKYRYTEMGNGIWDGFSPKGSAYSTLVWSPILLPNQLPVGDLRKGYNSRKIKSLSYDDVDFFTLHPSTDSIQEWKNIKLRKWTTNKGEIRTFKTLDSRVFNVNTLSKDVQWSTYKVFKDEISPLYQWYSNTLKLQNEWIKKFDPNVLGSWYVSKITNQLQTIKSNISKINSSLQSIYNFTIDDLSTYTWEAIVELWQKWENIFDTNLANKILEDIESTKILIHEFESQLEDLSIDEIQDDLKSMIYEYTITRKGKKKDPLKNCDYKPANIYTIADYHRSTKKIANTSTYFNSDVYKLCNGYRTLNKISPGIYDTVCWKLYEVEGYICDKNACILGVDSRGKWLGKANFVMGEYEYTTKSCVYTENIVKPVPMNTSVEQNVTPNPPAPVQWYDKMPIFTEWIKEINIHFKKITNNIAELQKTSQQMSEIYRQIGSLSRINLSSKKEEIDKKYDCKEKYYSELCKSLDVVNDTLQKNSTTINNKKQTINSFQFAYDDAKKKTYWIEAFKTFFVNAKKVLSEKVASYNQVIKDQTTITNDKDLEADNHPMNITTIDRPIDSPRYMTFQWVWWDKVNFIYPNLYKIEIFKKKGDMMLLKSPKEIEQAIREYLKKVAKKYNEYLIVQQKKKSAFYSLYASAFDDLSKVHTLASPKSPRKYILFSEDYFIKKLETRIKEAPAFVGNIWENTPLEFLAKMLYYQNLPWEEKWYSEQIEENIKKDIESFDVNKKAEYVLGEYLKQNNDQWQFITPDYKQDGYEVAYINSDGDDYIRWWEQKSVLFDLENQMNSYRPEDTYNLDDSIYDELDQELQIADECVSDVQWELLIDISTMSSPWWKAFKCRFKEIKESPLKLEITRPTWTDGNYFESFTDDIEKTLSINQKKWSALGAKQENEQILSELSQQQSELLEELYNYIQVKVSETSVSLDDPRSDLVISSTKSFWPITVNITTVGDLNIKMREGSTIKTLSETPTSLTFNPLNEKHLQLTISSGKIGYNVITTQICHPQIGKCLKKTNTIHVVPGSLNKVKLLPKNKKLLAGSTNEIEIQWLDKYWNSVGQLIGQYCSLSTNIGKLGIKQGISPTIQFNDFRHKNLLYTVPKEAAGKTSTITVQDAENNKKVFDTKTFSVVEGKLLFNIFDKKRDSKKAPPVISASLDDIAEYIEVDADNIQQIKEEALPKIKITLTDLQEKKLDITNKIYISTQNNILSPWIVVSKDYRVYRNGKKMLSKKKSFVKRKVFQFEDGELEISLLPSKKAGLDTVKINIPGVIDYAIPIKILPWKATQAIISFDKKSIYMGEEFKALVSVKDKRWNSIKDTGALAISPIWLSVVEKNIVPDGIQLTLRSWTKSGLWTLFARLKTVPLDQQRPAVKKIPVKYSYIPKTRLNVMYLNLFGSDWGNQWWYFSKNRGTANTIMANSWKLLATTTLLMKPDHIKQKVCSIEEKSQILSDNYPIYISVKEKKIYYSIWDIVELSRPSSDFQIKQIKNIQEISQDNTLYYIPNPTDSKIVENRVDKENSIIINGDKVFSLSEWWVDGIDIQSDYRDWAYMIFSLLYQKSPIWKIVVVASDLKKWEIISDARYRAYPLWTDWSTNMVSWIWIFDFNSLYSPSVKGYDSIEDSDDVKKEIGFWWKFKNITNFWVGLPVWEATLPFSSEFLINLWDPLVKRIDKNIPLETINAYSEPQELAYDWGIGQIVQSFPNKKIVQVLPIDFDNDGEKDIIVLFWDSSVRWLKKYQDTHNYQDMGELFIISEWIKNIAVWDTDGNGYPDIIVHTKKNNVRVYTNNHWMLDVDGFPVCLNINVWVWQQNKTPENIAVHQIFFRDMDNDGNIDIVTYDHYGFLKISYGGTSTYVSKENYRCDDQRYKRSSRYTKILKKFDVKIDTRKKIKDDTIIRWSGLTLDNQWDVSSVQPEQIGIEKNKIEGFISQDHSDPDYDQINDFLAENLNFDTDNAIEKYNQNVRPILTNQLGIKPYYENSLANYWYLRLWDLKSTDPIDAYKQYSTKNLMLRHWDSVKVQVVIEAKRNFVWTYSDTIKWPRKIKVSDDGWISRFAFDPDTVSPEKVDDLKIYWNLKNMNYVIDNIKLSAGEKIVRSYELEYIWEHSPMQIELKDIDGEGYKDIDILLAQYKPDTLLDIAISPKDACVKKQTILFNNTQSKNRSYDDKIVNIQQYMQEQALKKSTEQQNANNANRKNITKKLVDKNVAGIMSNATMEWRNNIWFSSEQFTLENIFANWWIDISGIGNVLNGAIDWYLLDATKKVDKFLDGLCNGFGWGWAWLPLPFNQAFFAPWNYHLFGCFDLPPVTKLLWKGWPALSIPGNWWPVGPTYIPAPNIFWFPFRWPWDDYLWWPKNGTNPSLLRMYLIPTLTAKMVVGMCFGKYNQGIHLPSPIWDIAGNCIAIGTDIGLWKKEKDEVKNDGSEANTNQQLDTYLDNLSTCTTTLPPLWPEYAGSPFSLTEGIDSHRAYIPQNSYMWGMFQIDVNPVIDVGENNSWLDFPDLLLQWWADQQNKITDGNPWGFIKKLIKDWMDRQTRYIINNLTKMNINLVLPKIWSIFEWFSEEPQGWNIGEAECKDRNWSRNGEKCIIPDKVKCENRGMMWAGGKCVWSYGPNAKWFKKLANLLQNAEATATTFRENRASELLNIVEQIEDTFREVPLVNIRTQNLYINIPSLSLQDIEAYILESKHWVARQKEILKQWEAFLVYFTWECSKKWTNESICQDLTATLEDFLKFRSLIESVIQNVETNIHTLSLYKKFPGQLYKMVHVQEKYLSEIAGVVNAFAGTLGMRMKTNAVRIASYVDALTVIITTLETYQILINFPVEWKEKCWTCTVDNYDQYSCKLGFLCPKLPVLPIPPFKIPNINVDLSNINIGLDIKLPKFNFTTHPVPLPDLPDIPAPPEFGLKVNFNLNFDIPLLPAPPELPELPSFIPNIKMKLPLLPPAPRIPKLPNEITSIIEIAESIGKIVCIVKRKIGLVSEQWLKAKVEQITQREYDVPLWDMIDFTPKWLDNALQFLDTTANTTLTDAPLRGFDIEIASYVNLEYNFDGIYAFFEGLVNAINSVWLDLEHSIEKWTNTVQRKANTLVKKPIDRAEDGLDKTIDWALVSLSKWTLSQLDSYKESGLLHSSLLEKFEKQIAYQPVEYDAQEARVTRENLLRWLQVLSDKTTNPDTKEKTTTLLQILNDEVDVQHTQIENIRVATQDIVTDHKDSLHQLANDIHKDYKSFYTNISNVRKVSEDKNITLRSKLFSMNTKNSTSTPAIRGSDNIKMDLSTYNDGIFAPVNKGKMASVVKSDTYAKTIDWRYTYLDMNADGYTDIILWDDENIYVKYHKNTIEKKSSWWKLATYMIHSKKHLQSIANQDIAIGGSHFRLYAPDYEVKNFITKWQSFDDISIWWDNKNYQKKDIPSGYIIKLNNKIDTFFEKREKLQSMAGQIDKQYIVVLPDDVLYTDKTIILDTDTQVNIADAMTWTILHVWEYNILDEKITVKIPQYKRKWKYLEIATLQRDGNNYTINSPWSNQIVAGSERSSDIQWPEIIWELERTSVGQKIQWHLLLEWYVGTHYNFNILLSDNILLSGTKVFAENWQLILEKKLSEKEKKITIEPLFFTSEATKKYTVEATDVDDNINKINITIEFKKPTILIDTIVSDKDKWQKTFPAKIVAKISHDIDEGVVNFYTKRRTRKILPGSTLDYLLKPLQTIVVGGAYQFSNAIEFINQAGEPLADLDPETWEIRILEKEKNKYTSLLTYTPKWPATTLVEKDTNKSIFTINLPPEQLIAVNEWMLEKVALNHKSFWKYNGGWALKKWNTIYMYISKWWDISVVHELMGRYEYDPMTKTVKYYFSNPEKKISEGYVQIKVKDFTEYVNYNS